jgi:cell wall-associated NlpC family hydrolase
MNEYIPAWVNAYIGLPFIEYNCYNLTRMVYADQLNIDLPDLDEEYSNSFDVKSIARLYMREMEANWEKIEVPVFGCMAVFRVRGVLWHCGIIVNNRFMLHTQNKNINSCLELFDNINWKVKTVGFYSYVG